MDLDFVAQRGWQQGQAAPDQRRGNLLLVTHRVPYPPDKGDRIRTFHLIRALGQRHRIYLAALADEPVSPQTIAILQEWCAEIAIVPLSRGRWLRAAVSPLQGKSATQGAFSSRRLLRLLRTWKQQYRFEVAMASASSVAWYLRSALGESVPAFIDLVDVDSQKWLDYAEHTAWPKSWLYAQEGSSVRRLERHIAGWAKRVLLVSDAERELFQRIVPGGNAVTVTNGVDLEYYTASTSPSHREGCVFVGALDYRPNVDAVTWFARQVWPGIFAQRTKARLRIVGRSPVSSVRDLASISGVEVVGQVPDVRPFLHEASVVIAPLRLGRGLQNKVLEAMAAGKAVVASSAACAGLKQDSNPPVIRAHSREEWQHAILQLFETPERARHLGEQARLYVETHYDWQRCLTPLLQMMEPFFAPKRTQAISKSGK
jgi:sugar transferase (PEP-CTERM/EpsH1 system associated)